MNFHLAKQHGATLIELMTVVSLGFILISIAIPSLSTHFERQRLIGIGDNLHFLMRYAKAQSAKSNQVMWIRLEVSNKTSNKWRIALADDKHCLFTASSPCTFNGVHHELRSAQYPGVTMRTNRRAISIDPLRGRGTTATVTFILNQLSLKLIKTQFGTHRVCSEFAALSMRYPRCI